DGDALVWLDDFLKTYPHLNGGLARVFPEFLTDFITWGDNKYSRSIGGDVWRRELFDGCTNIVLSPRQPSRSVALDVEMLGGHCIRIQAGNLAPGQLASIKAMVRSGNTELLDSLHLGLVSAAGQIYKDGVHLDPEGFDCYRMGRQWPRALGCLLMPITGERSLRDGGGFARTWSSFGQRSD